MNNFCWISLMGVCLTGCSAMMPDVAQIIHDVEDTAVLVEVNRDAIKDQTNVDINVKVTNKYPITN
jgi:hypothetical protein